MSIIYVCSPLREHDYISKYTNIDNAKKFCKIVTETGNIPIAPHLYFSEFLDDDNQCDRELGMNMGKELLQMCEELWVFGTYISDGMAQEIELATDLGKPIKFLTENGERRNSNGEKNDTTTDD